MPTTTGSHPVASFTSPVNGTSPIDANAVRNNDNALRGAYVAHDADPGIHVQSSVLASRPAASIDGRKWITTDGGVMRLWIDTGSQWVEVSAAGLSTAQTIALTGDVTGTISTTLATGASIATTLADNTVTSAKIVNGTIVDADINASAGIVDTKLATISTGGKVSNSATTATSANTNNAIVARDGSGNFSAGTITATLTGNASTATTAENLKSNATTGVLQVTGPGTGTTRVMTAPNANFTVARTDAAQTFTGLQSFTSIGLGSGGTACGIVHTTSPSATTIEGGFASLLAIQEGSGAGVTLRFGKATQCYLAKDSDNLTVKYVAGIGTGIFNIDGGDLHINGVRVVSARGASISKPTGGGTQDAQARTAIDAIIDSLQAHGLIA